jgi:hypothetical protein
MSLDFYEKYDGVKHVKTIKIPVTDNVGFNRVFALEALKLVVDSKNKEYKNDI